MAQEEGLVVGLGDDGWAQVSIERRDPHAEGGVSHLMAIDPVCSMTVNPAEAAASFTFQDNTCYLCHPGCKVAFTKNPEGYL